MSWSGILKLEPWGVSGGRLSEVSRRGLGGRAREPAEAAVCQDSSVGSLPKREMWLLREDLLQLGICGLYSLFRWEKGTLFYDGLAFLCDSFF